MNDNDRPAFAELLTATMQVYGGHLGSGSLAIWWAALAPCSLAEVRAGLSAHVTDPGAGRFAPKPADVIARIADQDGRPGADEAWAQCPLDEAVTTVWTDEARLAFFDGAYQVLADGDRIAARMAFKDAYQRHVAAARRARRPVAWSVSLGHDVGGREAVLLSAVERGRLPREQVVGLLPYRESPPAHVRALMRPLREKLVPRQKKEGG